MNLEEEIKKFFKGEVVNDNNTLKKYSRDASLFEVRPKLVVYPKDKSDLKNLVKFISKNKSEDNTLSLTMRAAGSDMSGGSLNESIIADVTKHINYIGEIDDEESITTEPGVFYRDFERKTLEKGFILPCFPASKNLSALGGMISNNCAGERTLRYGKMENFILEMKVILSDSNEYTIKPLNKVELDKKMAQEDFEGKLYKNLFNLIEGNREVINNAKPNVSKNSAGYYLWNIWDGETFDLNKLIVGSQGTLGVITEAKIRLVREKSHHDMVALFFKSWDQLPQVTKAILPYEPESLETFDEETLKLGIRFMPEIAKRANMGFFSFLAQFIPEAFIGTRMLGLPKLIILVEVAENDDKEVKRKVKNIIEAIRPFNVWHRVIEKDSEENKFWIMRRESFNLLREHVGNKKTAPFVEDFCILVEKVPEFLPKALKILKDNGIEANIAGHAGNGNFHIIPLMDLREKSERDKILVVSNKFYDLVKEYKGSITAEHNDGIVRTPYLHKMYNPEVLELFRKTKELFDPQNIFNPGKKVNGSFEYLESHIAIE
ncbi:MAG: Oxidoreductase [Parcubacteria group bacterium GW2011_GWB1_38_8]|uniref:FAD-binding PCMH-type domain-containing protein n=1 Tax=Candidatus Zambryskibacteria bacterium RIFCSPLOWO2_02_FULL_39_14 TaxID=1802769 RepID=A0A1G2UJ10_9BACT|nr:MAG: Oxidoreductase [Parcubacteria group bacterium GW2011_GWB1_38_8]OHA95420.1 MAG: hypothetical protein A3C62_02475 [Candidatus Zambryskibacteria bacterium RIFCSPHIGHO2_02_FULL_39_16]OHB09152.1 MAG: hypothetical protein A3I86_01750 [Candidatus Zambryskibacteria bacterium RIFCSPLOWO2_02_FULL_39_14]